jgi:hypothetical protein
VPVTAKLSRKFYDALGDEVANELVEWFNQVDLTYRTELRDLNELNFARFDAKLEARVERGFAEGDARLDAKLAAMRAELIKWMLLFWLGTVGLVLTLVTQLR